MEQKNNMELLSTLHYVWGGLTLLAALFVFIYVIAGAGLLFSGIYSGELSTQMTGGIFMFFGFFGFLLVVTIGILSILCGKYLKERRNRIFCLVMSGLACTNAPLGLLLGIFTIMEMEKPEIKKEFEDKKEQIEKLKTMAGV